MLLLVLGQDLLRLLQLYVDVWKDFFHTNACSDLFFLNLQSLEYVFESICKCHIDVFCSQPNLFIQILHESTEEVFESLIFLHLSLLPFSLELSQDTSMDSLIFPSSGKTNKVAKQLQSFVKLADLLDILRVFV